MPNKCIIVGCGAHASAVISVVENSDTGLAITGLIDVADTFDPAERRCGYPVIGTLNELIDPAFGHSYDCCVIAIGENQVRAQTFSALSNAGIDLPNIISRSAFVDRTVIMGRANVVMHGVTINAEVEIGSNNLINNHALVEHHSQLGENVHIGPRATLCGKVTVGDGVFLGAGSTVVPGVSVAEGVTLGAGSLLLHEAMYSHSVYIGSPAKKRNS